tara:strand:- start:235 stop:495 length:261 start_codon:yes stop_codon:yes gene_type:complete
MNTTGNKYGGRTKGTPNKLSSKIKDKLSSILNETIDSLDLDNMTKSERLKLIQLTLPYVITKPQIEETPKEPQTYQIEIIGGSGEK